MSGRAIQSSDHDGDDDDIDSDDDDDEVGGGGGGVGVDVGVVDNLEGKRGESKANGGNESAKH